MTTATWSVLCTLLAACVSVQNSERLDTPTFTPRGVKSYQDASGGYYRLMVMDPNSPVIYIGSMEYVYRLNLDDIRDIGKQYGRSLRLLPSDAETRECVAARGSQEDVEYQCKNHIRSIVIHMNHIYVCGTSAQHPRLFYLNKSNLGQMSHSGPDENGMAKCAHDPDHNSTYIYIDRGNPNNIASLYTGTVIYINKNDPVIYRPQLKVGNEESLEFLRSPPHNEKWLKEPSFVASFDMGKYVYFFFRETAIEHMGCGKIVYSRVARVCKSDSGGDNILKGRWTTYLKIRLQCSLPGDIPFDFNEIQDVYRSSDMFYAVFTTSGSGLFGSAVCGFQVSAVDEAFNGPFKEQKSSESFWRQATNVPKPRPGTCDAGLASNDQALLFMRDRPLLDYSVKVWGRQPMFYKAGVMARRIAVDFISDRTVLFLATYRGEVLKVVHWVEGVDSVQRSRQLATWTPLDNMVMPIWQMKLKDGQLYLSTDDRVVQFAVRQCESYAECTSCVGDPYCGWDRATRRCRDYQSGLLQSVRGDSLQFCSEKDSCNSGPYRATVRLHGDPVFLSCDSPCAPRAPVVWYRGRSPLLPDQRKYHVTRDNGLVLMNATSLDGATYRCMSGDVTLSEHTVEVTRCDNTDCYFKEEFRNWCSAFDNYKEQFNHWLCLKNTCVDDPSCMPNAVSAICPRV